MINSVHSHPVDRFVGFGYGTSFRTAAVDKFLAEHAGSPEGVEASTASRNANSAQMRFSGSSSVGSSHAHSGGGWVPFAGNIAKSGIGQRINTVA